jgi:heme exporter protein A
MLVFEDVALVRGGRLLFEGLNFTLGSNRAVHVTGPNGSGKSSLIRLAAGLLTQAAGRVERPATATLADDSLALDRELTLRRALGFWGGDVDAALEAAGLSELGAVPVRLLSSGQRKRATLARVYASGAPLWLLDEPLNALDSEAAERLSTAIARHLSDGGGVLAASHGELPGQWQKVALA